ncbi:dihydrofolate synthase/folylpolyglutamate synthase [Neolewinella xylanilytica]|uniref:Dihydrofolate synthase/folylpolyglutamate synthase n=1 Tax=Neolewinella xylanilytica TaxID=1514080 RepID=A0A2S6HZY3_9BACT|nr:Mur ligase family protein [Neolewinella xylanilytica]PPK84083.1 dihydrofolate synthase/folylpolyglutamate synthase [Neolewinella xylanilytica]
MNYADTLDYLFTRLPMYQRVGAAAMKKDLANIRLLLEALDHPERRFRCLHVAGTNGKGTVSHLLTAALQAHGFRTGLYTSPHYKDFRERIKVDGAFIPEEEVVAFVEKMQPAIERIEPSFFEITVAMAFAYFAGARVEWAVVEVGLGGRLDSTNVVDPEVAVITNIGYDHMQLLGETLAEIAGEKAGIIKPGRPVVIGETQAETQAVFRNKAAAVTAPITFADSQGAHPYETDLRGPFAERNIQTAHTVLEVLDGTGAIRIDPEKVAYAFNHVHELTYYIGRWQTLRSADPLVLADSAHNGEGLRPVLHRLAGLVKERQGSLHIVLGVVNDKDLSKALPLFPFSAAYYFVKADIPRGLPAAELQSAAATYGLAGAAYASVREGYEAALERAAAADVVFIGGSIFTVAEVL